MRPVNWNNRLYTTVLLLSMLVFVFRAMQAPGQNYSESYVTVARAQSSTIAF
ncbi:hypothetical protein [Ketobacter nezhaii]